MNMNTKQKSNDNPIRFALLMIAFSISALILFMCISSCKSCNQPPPPAVNEIQQITAQAKPVEDSLRLVLKQKDDSLHLLNKQLIDAGKQTAIVKSRSTATINKLTDALAKKDTAAIINQAQHVTNDFRAFVEATDKEDSVQNQIITTQAEVITTLHADVELQKLKFAKAADAYSRQSIQLDIVKTELYKTQKKLKRAKFFNKVLGIGTAAGIGLAAFIIL